MMMVEHANRFVYHYIRLGVTVVNQKC